MSLIAVKKLIAFQTSGDAVSGFIQRYIQANPKNTWEQIKIQLNVRFSDMTNAQNGSIIVKAN